MTVTYRHKTTGETRTLTETEAERFFDNRDPRDWFEIDPVRAAADHLARAVERQTGGPVSISVKLALKAYKDATNA